MTTFFVPDLTDVERFRAMQPDEFTELRQIGDQVGFSFCTYSITAFCRHHNLIFIHEERMAEDETVWKFQYRLPGAHQITTGRLWIAHDEGGELRDRRSQYNNRVYDLLSDFADAINRGIACKKEGRIEDLHGYDQDRPFHI